MSTPEVPVQYTCHNCGRIWEMTMEWIINAPVPETIQYYWTGTCLVCTPDNGPDPQLPKVVV